MTGSQLFDVFGLTVRSELPLPELAAARRNVPPDVLIETGQIPASFDPAQEFSISGDGVCLTIPDVARYWISRGERIVVEPMRGAPEANVRLFLLGSAMGVLLHQRGLLPLHANAVVIDDRAFAFAGPSGIGKSTLAAAFHDQGFRVIADDVCVIRFDADGHAFASPGIPRLRLWEEALRMTGRTSEAYDLSYAGDESFRKFDVPIGQGEAGAEVPLAAIYQLLEGPFEIRPITGLDAANMIFANTYRGQFIGSAGNPAAHWSASLNLVRGTPIFDLSRPRDLKRLNDDLQQIIQHARSVATNRDVMKPIR